METIEKDKQSILNLLSNLSVINKNKIEKDKGNMLNLLKDVSRICKYYDKIAEITGEKFNIFQILKVSTQEVRMHSAFLCELLNPNGSHGAKDIFLKLFLEQQRGEQKEKNDFVKRFCNFNTTVATANPEIYIGPKNEAENEGGRIDILINDTNQNIIIENKIYAEDQYKQLVRYNNAYEEAPIFYLNLFNGISPSPDSKGELEDGNHFVCISYEKDILNWLGLCLKETISLPMLREVINQYIYLIKILTNQTTNNKMEKEIVDSIIKSPENIKAAFEIAGAIEKIKEGIILKLFESLNEGIDKDRWELKLGNEPPLYNGLGFCYRLLNKKYQIYIRLSKGYFQIDLLLYFDGSQDEITASKINFHGKWLNGGTTYYRNSYIVNDELINIENMKGKINEDVIKIVETLKEQPGL